MRGAQQELPEVHQRGNVCPLCKSEASFTTLTHIVGHCSETVTVRQTTWTHCKSLTWSSDDDGVKEYQNSLNAALDSENVQHTQEVQSWVAVTTGDVVSPMSPMQRHSPGNHAGTRRKRKRKVYRWRHTLLTATAPLLEYSLRSAQTAVWSLPRAHPSKQNTSDMRRWLRRHNG